MPGGDELLRRFGPGVFAMVAGYAAGWALLDLLGGPLSPADRSPFLRAFVVLAVATALIIDTAPLHIARRFGLPRTWIVVAFVHALVLAALGPGFLIAVHLGHLGALEALLLWTVPFVSGVGYVAVGVALGRIAR